MKYTNILVPYDRSESAKRALSTALEIAADEDGAHVTVFFASPVPEFESAQFLAAENMSGVVRIPPEELAAMQKEYLDYERGLLVDDLKDFVGEAVLSCADAFRIAVGQGKPSKAIVMGCRGLNAVAGMLGSVSYAVLRNASCPVLIEK